MRCHPVESRSGKMSVPAVADLAPALVIAEREHDIDALRAPHSAGAVLAKCPNMFAQVGVFGHANTTSR